MASIQSKLPNKIKQVVCLLCDKQFLNNILKHTVRQFLLANILEKIRRGLSLIFANKITVDKINDNSFGVVSFPVDPLSMSC